MKIFKNTAKINSQLRKVRLSIFVLALVALLPACNSDEVGDNFYTFTGETVGQYIKNRPEKYSEFTQVLDVTGVMGLLNAYGDYTCFLPTDDAMKRYYQSKGKSSVDDFTKEELKKIAYNHIIKDFEIPTDEFVQGFLTKQTMSGRYVDIGISSDETEGLVFTINSFSKIIERDIEAHNGVIHAINEAVSPTDNTLVEAI